VQAAYAAGEGLKRDFAAIAELQVRHKQGLDDKFSEADLRAEQTVREMLSAYRPDYGFLGEEGGLVEGADPDNVWIVDPLDGTTNFLIGLPLFAVNIALAHQGIVVAGVTHIPLLAETFWAERGQGAFLNGSPIRISDRREMIDAVFGVGIPFASKPRHEQFAAEMLRLTPQVSGIRRLRPFRRLLGAKRLCLGHRRRRGDRRRGRRSRDRHARPAARPQWRNDPRLLAARPFRPGRCHCPRGPLATGPASRFEA